MAFFLAKKLTNLALSGIVDKDIPKNTNGFEGEKSVSDEDVENYSTTVKRKIHWQDLNYPWVSIFDRPRFLCNNVSGSPSCALRPQGIGRNFIESLKICSCSNICRLCNSAFEPNRCDGSCGEYSCH